MTTSCSPELRPRRLPVDGTTNIDDIVGCKDQAGQATGIPDIPGVTAGYLDACGSVIFPLNGSQIDCSTQTSTPQTYVGLDGDSKYLQKKYGPLHGTLVVSSDSKATQRSSTVLGLFAQKAGIKIERTVPMTSRAAQVQYTPVIQQIKAGGDNYSLSGTPVTTSSRCARRRSSRASTTPSSTGPACRSATTEPCSRPARWPTARRCRCRIYRSRRPGPTRRWPTS